MANKLKIFEKLGLLEKKEVDLESQDTLMEVQEKATEDASSVEGTSYEATLNSTEIQTPMLDSNPIIQSALAEAATQLDEAKSNLLTNQGIQVNSSSPSSTQVNGTLGVSFSKDNQVIEDVEKKLDAMIESYERNKLLSIEDIYRKANLINDVKSTVFMVDVYAKALPENLPLDVKRDSVLNIMKASELRVDDLLSDAYKRIDALNNILENVVQTTEELKTKNTATIRDLEKRIDELKRNIVEREKFQETQNTMIEYEIQRIINIVDFVKPK